MNKDAYLAEFVHTQPVEVTSGEQDGARGVEIKFGQLPSIVISLEDAEELRESLRKSIEDLERLEG